MTIRKMKRANANIEESETADIIASKKSKTNEDGDDVSDDDDLTRDMKDPDAPGATKIDHRSQDGGPLQPVKGASLTEMGTGVDSLYREILESRKS